MEVRPKVTVITPVYNASRWIEETVRSVVSQTGVSFEYLIIDDGSTDDSYEVFNSLVSGFPVEVLSLRQENQGEALAINNALRFSRGDYVCVVSADDPLLPGHLSELSSFLDCNPDVVVVYPDWLMISQTGEPLRSITTLDFSQEALIADFVCIPGPGAMIRRSKIDGNFLRDPRYRYVSDYAAWLRLSLRGSFVRLPKVLASYRVHPDQATRSGRGAAMADEIEKVVHDFFSEPIPAHVRKLERRALAFSRYYAGLQNLHAPSVPGRKRMLLSIVLQPPVPVRRATHRRHPLALVAVLSAPIGSYVYRFVSRKRENR